MRQFYTYYLIGSGLSLLIGGYLLYKIVPVFLSIATFTLVVVLFIMSYLVRVSRFAINVGFVIAILGILVSSFSPAHDRALIQLFDGSMYLVSVDILMILGFYLFPILYIINWIFDFVSSRKGVERRFNNK
ncbi:hypothetical protein SUSAZ_05970 [Sulfolobus acidocaldarius SUSAZ]|nr:hypothetical protein SUSAZ_05970 [Sulfolobus acidocaldarius SUSAZ]